MNDKMSCSPYMNQAHHHFLVTVCTVTFNRAQLLPRVYECLCAQTFRDFEWLIVDDGSTDGTKDLVQSWIPSAPFTVRYVWQRNTGQYSAMNVGVREAAGRFFASLDSDDRYRPQTLERFLHHWETIPEAMRDRFVGICGLGAHESGQIVGTRFPQDVLDSDDIDIRIKYRVEGDKVSLMRTDVMRQFPFPEDCGRHLSPSIVWNRIGRKYQTRFVNEIFGIIEYQRDGLTAKSRLNRIKEPRGAALGLQELINSKRHLPLSIAIKVFANYIRFSLHEGTGIREQIRRIPPTPLFFFCLPSVPPLGAATLSSCADCNKPHEVR